MNSVVWTHVAYVVTSVSVTSFAEPAEISKRVGQCTISISSHNVGFVTSWSL